MKMLLLLFTLLIVPTLHAEEPVTKLYEKCAHCHGDQGQLSTFERFHYAVIGGKDANFLENQLLAYKDGNLNLFGLGALMTAELRPYSKEDLKRLADYISTLKP
jgi:cytochrome c553